MSFGEVRRGLVRRVVAGLVVLGAIPVIGSIQEGAGLAAPPVGASAFAPVSPSRLADTRQRVCGCTPTGVDEFEVQVTGRAGVPVGATSAVLTLTVAAPAGYGFLTAWPADLARPVVSSVNVSRAGVTVANTQIIPLSASGAVRVFTSTPAAVIVDVTGYFVPAPMEVAAGRFQPTAPIRLVDTRQPGGGGVLAAGETRTYNPAPRVGVAYSALAVNITMTGTTGLSYVTAWPGNQSQPGTSNVNADAAGENRAAFAIVPTSSTIKVFASAGTHVVVDIVGIFTDASAPVDEAGLFVPVAPSRWIDTRSDGGKFTAGETRTYTHAVTVPAAGSVFGNVTMAEAAPGYLTTWRAGDVAPSTSTANSSSVDSTIANGAILTLSAGRQISVRSAASTFVIVDEFGWFISAPVIQPPATTTTGPGTTVPPFVGCNDLPIDAFNTWRTTEGVPPLAHSNKIYDSACKWAMALVTSSPVTFSYWDYGTSTWRTDTVTPTGHSPGTFRAYEWGVSGSLAGPPPFTFSSGENLAAFGSEPIAPQFYGFAWWRDSPGHYASAVSATFKTSAVADACGLSPVGIYRCATVAQFSSATPAQLP